jgi:hypothetical protein
MTSQDAFWSRDDIVLMPARNAQARRKKSGKRRRTKMVALRLFPSEYTALTTAARKAHISLSELIRSGALTQIATNDAKES